MSKPKTIQKMIQTLIGVRIAEGNKNAYAHLAVELDCSETWIRGLDSGNKTAGKHLEKFIRSYYDKVVDNN